MRVLLSRLVFGTHTGALKTVTSAASLHSPDQPHRAVQSECCQMSNNGTPVVSVVLRGLIFLKYFLVDLVVLSVGTCIVSRLPLHVSSNFRLIDADREKREST